MSRPGPSVAGAAAWGCAWTVQLGRPADRTSRRATDTGRIWLVVQLDGHLG